jgi:glycosidase
LDTLLPWVAHVAALGCNALYLGPVFQSGSHGYDTTDYRTVDCRLGDNDDLRRLVAACHGRGIRVILDGVFNHVGRDFFAFRDLREKREQSPYRDWFCNVNYYGNNEYHDGFSYDNWGGYNLLVKLNQRNGQVQRYLCDAIRAWVAEFDIDGLRLDAADVLDFGFMQVLRRLAEEVKPEFWLMGEVIHGEYTRWVNGAMLHSVTDYALHKALYSSHNDRNYFEIAHTVKRLRDMGLNRPGGARLYSFADNHDVDRIASKLRSPADLMPLYVLLYTLPGIPSVYYGSEFGLEGRKQRGSDDELRPAIDLNDYADAALWNPWTGLITALGQLRRSLCALWDGDYREIHLTTGQFVFAREKDGQRVIVAVNNADGDATVRIGAGEGEKYFGALSGQEITAAEGGVTFTIPGHGGEIWIGAGALDGETAAPRVQPAAAIKAAVVEKEAESAKQVVSPAPSPADHSPVIPAPVAVPNKPYEEMTVEELQSAILEKLAKNGPVTDRMRRDVTGNVWHDSLVNWVKSFR